MTSAPPSNDDHRDSAARLHLTVASVIEREGRFLMVEEQTRQGRRFNQPAGHLEPGESLLEGARRELLEETAWEAERSEERRVGKECRSRWVGDRTTKYRQRM